MVREFFKPSALGVVMMVWLLGVQAGVLTRTRVLCSWGPVGTSTYWHRYGLPTAFEVSIRTRSDSPTITRTTRILWPQVLMIVAGAYCAAMPMGRWLGGGRGWVESTPSGQRREDRAVLILMILSACILAGCAATGLAQGIAARPRERLVAMLPSIVMHGSVLAVLVAIAALGWRRWCEARAVERRGFAVETTARPTGA